MKYFCLLFLIGVLIQPAFAQTKKTFITNDGSFSDDAKNAVAYLLIQKLDGDSAYMVKQYDMRDTILSTGFYKDELLTIANGKFTYYSQLFAKVKDTSNNYIQQVGHFLNGEKSGTWITYSADGLKQSIKTFEHGELNGPFTVYDNMEGWWTTGTMVNNVTTGSTYIYNADSLLVAETIFKNGKPVDHIEHLQDARPKYNFESYMDKKLKMYKDKLIGTQPLLKFTVTKDGKIINPGIIHGVSPEIDSAIIVALSTAPPFAPAKYNGVITQVKTSRLLVPFSIIKLE